MTNERWSDSELPTGGQIARFVKPHLDKAKKLPSLTLERAKTLGLDGLRLEKNESLYAVAVKARPMFVLERLRREHGRRWFLVLPITTKPDERWKHGEDYYWIDKCIEADKSSFVEMRPLRLPDNLFDGEILKPCNPIEFDRVLKILTTRRVGYRSGNNDKNQER